jgi:alcohol dehydrogenase class IV
MNFEFATASRIVFGRGKLVELQTLGRSFGRRALIVTGRNQERILPLQSILAGAQVESVPFGVPGEPSVESVRSGADLARKEGCDWVIGIGGGSPMDAGKAIAALLTNPGDLFDYLEVVGRGQPLLNPSAPCVTIPTTAGTGAEVTRNAVLASPEHRFKVSLRSAYMLPRLALVDPELSAGLSPEWTAATGLDALTQLIEPYVSHRANPFTDGFCLEGMRRVARSLRRAYQTGSDLQAREDLALAALLSGLALANAALGAVHGFAAPLGGMYSAPHGAICAALLPHAMVVNLRALRAREPKGEGLRRYTQLAQVLTGDPAASADDGVCWVQELCADLRIPSLRGLGVRAQDFPELVEKASKASSMKGNPLPLQLNEMHEILTLAQ